MSLTHFNIKVSIFSFYVSKENVILRTLAFVIYLANNLPLSVPGLFMVIF